MANVKITELTALTDPASSDVLPIVDVASDQTKKVTIADLLENAGAGSAGAAAFAFDGDADTGMYRTGANALGFTTGGTGRLFIDSAGNAGIGDSNPSEKLSVAGKIALIGTESAFGNSAQPTIYRSGSTSGSYPFDNFGHLIIQPRADGAPRDIVFATGNTGANKTVINSSGNIGIGETNPSSLLHLSSASSPAVRLQDTTNNCTLLMYSQNTNSHIGTSSNHELFFDTNGSQKMMITTAGNVGINTSLPGSRLQISDTMQATANGHNQLSIIGDDNGTDGESARIYLSAINATNRGCGIAAERQSSSNDHDLIFQTSPVSNIPAERLRITGDGNIGIGTNSPAALLHLYDGAGGANQTIRFGNPAAVPYGSIKYSSSGLEFLDLTIKGTTTGYGNIRFFTGSTPSEAATIDSSGRLLVGTSSARTNFFNTTTVTAGIQAEATGEGSIISAIRNINDANSVPVFLLAKSRGTAVGSNTIVQANDQLGYLSFQGSDGGQFVEAAQIRGEVDGTPGTDDMPGRLVFSVTRDGQPSPTEALRISNSGQITHATEQNVNQFIVDNTNASFASSLIFVDSSRAANTVYSFFYATSSNGTDTEFNLRGDGNGFCDGSWTGGGADYAEYFEWSDLNPNTEDRRGISVVLDGDKIREAQAGEDPIGVISGNPSVVGDAAWNKWTGKYLRDDFGTYIQEDYEVEDDDGNIVVKQRRKLNPDYNPDIEYISREDRPEWDCVGLMGKLRIRKGQITGSRWIKMRDVSDSVEEWLVR